MSSISSWIWPTSELDEAIDKATSELIPSGSEDVALNLEICDQIRSKSAPAKDAMRALKRRLNHKNPNVQLLALGLTDTCVKNGGDHFLTELASREFMDNLVSILKMPSLNHLVKTDILKYIQNWSLAFEGKHSLQYVGQVYKTLKSEGYEFPPKDLALANSAMVDTSTAPEWIDSDVCLRCRTSFTFTNRKHHCRNCGLVFDHQCSSKATPLPHFGITQAVRVCDGCYAKLTRKGERSDKAHRQTVSMYSPRHSSARDLADAELQRAIQLSLQEVSAAHGHRRPGYVPSQPAPSAWQISEPPLVDRSTHPDFKSTEEDDPDLRAAIEASLREANAPRPSAPVEVQQPEQPNYQLSQPTHSQSYPPTITPASNIKVPSYDLDPLESDAILTFSQTVEQVQAQGGRDMTRYPAVNELFDKANGLRPKLALTLDDTGRKEQMLSEMHDKLSQAVKLYDKLLTEQISHPTWRRSPPEQRSPALPGQSSHRVQSPYSTVAPSWNSPSQSNYSASPSDQLGYHQYPAAASHLHEPAKVNGSSLNDHSQRYAPSSQPNFASSSTSNQAPLYNGTSSQPQRAPTSLSSPTQPAQSAPIHHYTTVAQSTPARPSLPPATSPLGRHHTVTGAGRAPLSPPPPPNTYLGRSNTTSYQRHIQSPPAALPQFPTVPTSNPQAFDMYGPSVPSNVGTSIERREELLIDL
ncbi:hypothetical protein BJ138DRAFT_1153929 [Hygrophoropsis aurantiaca]|uniref:Uncharacterized protein n=1 Tax=Hygrophoropsis aurantiaca TaxID=72124 RepID=A0ACB8A980_9AGAM|nr:hypothetical protein BJ138DRAFT_1153929 [Hygrophoropsis aurantiaca]